MAHLSSELVLKRVADYSLSLRGDGSNGSVSLFRPSGVMRLSRHALPLLSLFSRPCRVDWALDLLAPAVESSAEWIEIRNTLADLWGNGLLTPVDPNLPQRPHADSYSDPAVHLRMINDHTRTKAFVDAIDEVVQAGDRVLEIGAGTGILAAHAARAGAKTVYAIERGGMAQAAQALFIDNGFAEQIVLVPAESTKVELADRCDVLVTEMLGHETINEGLLPLMADGKHRLLSPSGLCMPSRVKVFGTPLLIPENELSRLWFLPATIDAWNGRYDISFEALERTANRWPLRALVHPSNVARWTQLAESIMVADFDLSAPSLSGQIDSKTTFASDGEINAVALYFEAELSPSVTLSTAPGEAPKSCHWSNAVWFHQTPERFRSGDELKITYRFRHSSSELHWSVERGETG